MQWLRKLWWRISDWAAATDSDFAYGEEDDDPYYDGYFVRATSKNALNNDLPGREYWYSVQYYQLPNRVGQNFEQRSDMPVGWRYGKWVYDEPPAGSMPQAVNAVCTQHMLHHGRPCPHRESTGSRRLTTTASQPGAEPAVGRQSVYR